MAMLFVRRNVKRALLVVPLLAGADVDQVPVVAQHDESVPAERQVIGLVAPALGRAGVVVAAVELDDHGVLRPVGVDEDAVDALVDERQRDRHPSHHSKKSYSSGPLVRASRGWLIAIARNVCLAWGRGHGREMARGQVATEPLPEDRIADAFDLEIELEREDLAARDVETSMSTGG